jgi:hypothetical protein
VNPAPNADAQRKMEGLHALANLAEKEGRHEAALALATWADATATYAPYPDEEIQRLAPGWARRDSQRCPCAWNPCPHAAVQASDRAHRMGGGR